MPAKEQRREQKKGESEGKAPKKQIPMTEEEKAANANIAKCEKQLEELTQRLKEVMGKIHEKDSTRRSLLMGMIENREAIKKKNDQMEQKRKAQKESLDRALKYIDALRNRKHRRSDERAELVKLLPRDAELPPLNEEDEESTHSVSDYDRAIKIVQHEIERLTSSYATKSSGSVAEERKQIAAVARWNNIIEQIKELEKKAAAPLAELAEVDVMTCLETCRKLKEEIREISESCVPLYNAIAEASKKMADNSADAPKLVQERVSIFAQIKETVDHLHELQFEADKAHYKSLVAYNEKRRANLLQESAEIKARIEEAKKNREEIIKKAMNSLPHEREVAVAREVLASLRSVALPGTCGIPESAGAPKPKAQPTLASAPAMELEEAAPAATTMVISRKSQPVAKVAKKNKKKKAPAADASEGPKKRSKEDHVRIPPIAANGCQELAVNIPDTYGEVEETYNLVKEKLEGFEKIRAMVREQREKELQEAEKKAEERAAEKAAERAKAKAEAEGEKPAEEKDEAAAASAAEPAAAEESAPAAEEAAAAAPAAEESQ